MAILKQSSDTETFELGWNDYLHQRQLFRYKVDIDNRSGVRLHGLVAKAVNRFYYWYSEDACVGFDILQFFQTGFIFSFDENLETIERALAACGVDTEIPIRVCTYEIDEEQSIPLSVIGPISDDRIIHSLLQAWRNEMVLRIENNTMLEALLCLFDLYDKRENPNNLLDQLRIITETFGWYDSEFCAHSCGELFARPLLDCAAVLALADVTFVEELPGVYQTSISKFLDERHFEEFVVPGLAFLLLEHLEIKDSLSRFGSIQKSGDRAWVASFSTEQFPEQQFGKRSFSDGARFVVASDREIDDKKLEPALWRFVIVIEKNWKLHFILPVAV